MSRYPAGTIARKLPKRSTSVVRRTLYLASSSPRRRDLLDCAQIPFVLHPPGPEPVGEGSPRALAILRARSKATEAPAPNSPGVILGVDTVVDLDSAEMGKPVDASAAAAMLRRLSGREHRVLTAHCLFDTQSGGVREECVESVVRCDSLAEQQLATYLDSGDWADKAGGYGIQSVAGSFMHLVSGDLDTVIGLHVASVRRLLTAS